MVMIMKTVMMMTIYDDSFMISVGPRLVPDVLSPNSTNSSSLFVR